MAGVKDTVRRQWLGATVGMLALFVALGGPALAEPVADAAARLITGKQVKKGTLTERHLSSAARAKLRGAAGPAGPAGPAGAVGAIGPAGATGLPGAPGRDGADGIDGQNGIDGVDGQDGIDGTDGADGQDGRSFRWRGAWSSLVTYSLDDVVSFQGASLIATRNDPNPPNAPGASHWNVMAAKGDPGTPGQDGADGEDGRDATSLWAVVSSEGDLLQHSGVVALDKGPGSPGTYLVRFNRQVENCAYVATLGAMHSSGWLGGEVTVGWLANFPNAVHVRTYNSGLSEASDRPFHLAVFCP